MKNLIVLLCVVFLFNAHFVVAQPTSSAKEDDGKLSTPIVHIKARFIEVPESFRTYITQIHNYFPAGITNGRVLSNPDFQVFLHDTEQQSGAEELAGPEAETFSGRQTQMRATTIQPVVSKYTLGEASAIPNVGFRPDSIKIFSDGSAIIPQMTKVETGPGFDVVPMILPGNYKIDLKITAPVIEFLGFEEREKVPFRVAVPKFQVKQASLDTTLYDGQTLVLFPKPGGMFFSPPDGQPWESAAELRDGLTNQARKVEKQNENKFLIVLVTVTLIDAAGNRIHSDDQIPSPITPTILIR